MEKGDGRAGGRWRVLGTPVKVEGCTKVFFVTTTDDRVSSESVKKLSNKFRRLQPFSSFVTFFTF